MKITQSYISPDLEELTNYDTKREDAERHAKMIGYYHAGVAEERQWLQFDLQTTFWTGQAILDGS